MKKENQSMSQALRGNVGSSREETLISSPQITQEDKRLKNGGGIHAQDAESHRERKAP